MRNATPFVILLCILTLIPELFGCYLPATKPSSACDELQPDLVPRDQWCAREASEPMECLWGPVGYVIIHHTVGGACSTTKDCSNEMKKMQDDHMDKKKWPDLGYHFVIGGDARAYVGRPCSKMGGHTKNHNRKSIGIAFFGNYQKDCPTPQMMDLVPKICNCAVEQGYLHPDFLVIGHRDAFCSTCPGDALYAAIKKWTRYPDKVPLPSYSCDNKTTTTTTTTEEATTTTTTTTTVAPTTTEVMSTTRPPEVVLPVYVYFLWPKKRIPCCHD